MVKKREEVEKKLDELLSLVSKEDKPKAVKLMWEMFYPDSRPVSIKQVLLLDIVAKRMKELGIREYLPTS